MSSEFKEPIEMSELEPGISAQDLKKVKELLHHAGEFIAYFEVAESKLLLWQQGLETQVKEQEEKISRHFSSLSREIAALKSLLTEFRQLDFKQSTTLKQVEAERLAMQKASQALLAEISLYHHELKACLAKNPQNNGEPNSQILVKMKGQLTPSDNCQESSSLVQRSVKERAVGAKTHWSFLGLSLVLSCFSIFSMGLYLCNEWPWESRLRVLHEREVGRALLQAWPRLSQEERDKILAADKDG